MQPAHLGKQWSYAIEWIPGQTARKSIAILTSRPRSRDENQLIAIRSWTDRDNVVVSASPSANNDAVTVFAQVLKGRRPVLGARVVVKVEVEADNGTVVTILPLHLLDNGDGGGLIYDTVLTLPNTKNLLYRCLKPINGFLHATKG